MNTNPETHPFHLQLARDAGWPLVTRDGRKAEVFKWNSRGVYSLLGFTIDEVIDNERCWAINGEDCFCDTGPLDLFLSADYSDPAVRAAVQRAHEKLGMEVVWMIIKGDEIGWRSNPIGPFWYWDVFQYRLSIHVPAPVSPIAPGHNPHALTVEQVGEGWRLLDESEHGDHSETWWQAVPNYWLVDKWGTTAGYGETSLQAYRTRLSREDLAKLDAPAWQLPVPPAGQRWHRVDFTEADLPEGWRPLLWDEDVEKGDEWECGDSETGWAVQIQKQAGLLGDGQWQKHRTRRPLPSPEPIVTPWTFETGPMVIKVKRKTDGKLFRASALPVFVGICSSIHDAHEITYSALLRDFTQLDGTLCGEVKGDENSPSELDIDPATHPSYAGTTTAEAIQIIDGREKSDLSGALQCECGKLVMGSASHLETRLTESENIRRESHKEISRLKEGWQTEKADRDDLARQLAEAKEKIEDLIARAVVVERQYDTLLSRGEALAKLIEAQLEDGAMAGWLIREYTNAIGDWREVAPTATTLEKSPSA